MYTLTKTRNGETEVVGFYDSIMEGAAAIEEDRAKFDAEAEYRLEGEDDDRDRHGVAEKLS